MKTRLRNFLIGLVGAVIIALGLSILTATTAATSFFYTVTDLGSLGGSSSAKRVEVDLNLQPVNLQPFKQVTQQQNLDVW
jgi:hypothetical protein